MKNPYLLTYLLTISLLVISCKKTEPVSLKNSSTQPDKLTVDDINFNSEEDENSILLYLRMQEEFAITLKQFNNLFNNHLSRTGLNRRITLGEISPENLSIIKKSFFLELISDELYYQEGLRIPEIVITTEEIERRISKEMLKNNKMRHVTFDEFLQSGHFSNQDYSLKIKKELYVKKVLNDQMKFMTTITPNEIEAFYLKMLKSGRLTQRFREVFLIEYPSTMDDLTQQQIDEIKDLNTFITAVKEDSIHISAKNDGLIEDVPFRRTTEFRNNKNYISNLFFEELWVFPLGKASQFKIDDRQFLIWINKDFEKRDQMTMDIQQKIIGAINRQKKMELEFNYTLKIADNFIFKVRYNKELVPLNLKKFIQNTLTAFQKAEQQQ